MVEGNTAGRDVLAKHWKKHLLRRRLRLVVKRHELGRGVCLSQLGATLRLSSGDRPVRERLRDPCIALAAFDIDIGDNCIIVHVVLLAMAAHAPPNWAKRSFQEAGLISDGPHSRPMWHLPLGLR